MKDPHTIERVALLHPKIRQSITQAIDNAEASLGLTFRVVQGFRTFAEQAAIYAQGRTTPGEVVTYSPPGSSYHNYGLAVDVAPIIFKDGKPFDLDWNFDQHKLVPFFTAQGFTWGGKFPHPDLDHYENKFGHNWRDLLHLYNTNQFIAGTHYVTI